MLNALSRSTEVKTFIETVPAWEFANNEQNLGVLKRNLLALKAQLTGFTGRFLTEDIQKIKKEFVAAETALIHELAGFIQTKPALAALEECLDLTVARKQVFTESAEKKKRKIGS